MKKNNLTLRETFSVALENYKKKNFSVAENLCNKILSIDSSHFDSLLLLSNICAIQRNFDKAKSFLIKANEVDPKNLTILNNLGTAYKELGNIKEAIKFYEKVIKIKPNHANAQFNLGVAFYNLKQFKRAKDFFVVTTKIQPNFALAFQNLANVQVELREYQNAAKNYQEAININPNLVSAHNNLGLVLRGFNEYEKAISCYEKAIKINPQNPKAYHNLAMAQKELGNFDKSASAHLMAIKYEPDNLVNYFYLSEVKKDTLNHDLKSKIKEIIKNNNSNNRNLAYGNFLLSRYERKSKNYEKELDYLVKGHKHFFDSKKDKFQLGVKYCFEDVMQISEGAVVEKKDDNNSIIKPIFIIGVPRCGSTLVEMIIGSGTKKIPRGEETTVFENFINSKILEKKSLNLGDAETVSEEIAEIYKERKLLIEKSNYIFTDKSLNNFFYLGLIKDIYPNAKVINCNRSILSSIVSIFQNNMTELAWTHDLSNIFKYFDNYFAIMKKYRKLYPNYIYELQYEKLVNNPEQESKNLMKFCNLPWDKKCLEFYKKQNVISKTASNIQIREAIYKHSSEKYLPYKKILNKYGKKYPWFE